MVSCSACAFHLQHVTSCLLTFAFIQARGSFLAVVSLKQSVHTDVNREADVHAVPSKPCFNWTEPSNLTQEFPPDLSRSSFRSDLLLFLFFSSLFTPSQNQELKGKGLSMEKGNNGDGRCISRPIGWTRDATPEVPLVVCVVSSSRAVCKGRGGAHWNGKHSTELNRTHLPDQNDLSSFLFYFNLCINSSIPDFHLLSPSQQASSLLHSCFLGSFCFLLVLFLSTFLLFLFFFFVEYKNTKVQQQ